MSAHPEQSRFSKGSRLGPYEIASSIGAGGMGEVFRARDTRLNRDVAVKVLPKDFVADADRLRRFEQEAKTLAALNHPNVLTIHDAGVHEGAPYLVSELLEGKTLREEMSGGALPVRKATEYGLQIAHGLAAANGKGVIHRDLKPENIFVTKDGRVKILDFGLAKLKAPVAADVRRLHSKSGEKSEPPHVGCYEGATIRIDPDAIINTTEPGMVLGTPAYMSPEQVRGESADHRADIFAFGCVLYEMLSGVRAFRRNTPVESMNAVLNDAPPELSTTHPNIPLALARIVERCLEKQPDNRFQSAKDLAFAIEAARDKGHPAPSGRQHDASANSRQRQVVFGIAALVLLAGGIGWWLVHRSDQARKQVADLPIAASATPRRITSLAVLPFKNYSGETNQEFFADGMTDLLTTELGGIGALTVKSHQSALKFKGSTKSMPEIGQELHADAIVEGSVLREGSQVTVNVQLIEAMTDRHLWAKKFERDVTNIFKMRNEVVEAIAREIQVTLSPEQSSRLGSAKAVNPAALQEYLLGRQAWNRQTEKGLAEALEHFNRAKDIDPSFALAWAGVADVYWSGTDTFVAPTEAGAKAKAAAQRALALDDSLAEAHLALAAVKFMVEFQWTESELGFQRAIRLKPNYAAAHWQYGWLLVFVGRLEEALKEMQRAVELDPLSSVMTVDLNVPYQFGRKDYDRAAAQCRKSLELDPSFFLPHFVLGTIEMARGTNYLKAIEEFRVAQTMETQPIITGYLGYAYARNGQKDKAMEMLDELNRLASRRFVSPYCQALVYLGLRENSQAIDWLEKAYEGRSQWLDWLKVDPLFDPVRSEPRFQALYKKMNFPP